MSEFKVTVVEVGDVQKHPNADSLSVARVFDYPVVIRTGEFSRGDRAVYIPVDSLVPTDRAPFEFLAYPGRTRERIKAKKLRGVFSMGLLVRASTEWPVGFDACEALGVAKYEPAEHANMCGEDEPDPGFLPVYTDIEGLRRWTSALSAGEEVVLTEKVHGANGRFLFHEGRLWVGSHTRIKREDPKNLWWGVAIREGLAAKLMAHPGVAVYGEVYGQVQDLKYGVPNGARLVLFDAFSLELGRYLDHDDFTALAAGIGLPTVPTLYRGPWSDSLRSLAEGVSTVPGASNVREGFVAKPVRERWDDHNGRVIVKLHGEGYLTRKEPRHG